MTPDEMSNYSSRYLRRDEQKNLEEITLAYRSNHDVQWLVQQLAAERSARAAAEQALADAHARGKYHLARMDKARAYGDAHHYLRDVVTMLEVALAAAAAAVAEGTASE